MSFSLTKKRRQLFTYDIALNQVVFSGTDTSSNEMLFPSGSTVKVYHNDLYVDPTDYTISDNEITFNTSPNTDSGTHNLKVIVQSDMTTRNDYAIKIEASAETMETYLIENDPNYDPDDTNSYYSKIRIADDYLRAGSWSSKDFAISTAMDAISDSKAYTNAEVLSEISRATAAETDLEVRLGILEAASSSGYELNTFVATQGQSTFNLNYDVGQVAVFINGILLDQSDYTATDGATIVLTEPADADDIISIPEYSTSGAVGTGGTMAVSDVPPTNPDISDMWFDTSSLTGFIYYNDGTSSQWVPINSVGSVGPQGPSTMSVYPSLADFPTVPDLGEMAFADDTDLAYVHDSTQWRSISTAASSILPTQGGALTLGASPTWAGSAGITVSQQSSGNYRITFPTAYDAPDNYTVSATYQDYTSAVGVYVNITRAATHMDVNLYRESDSVAVDVGAVTILVYEF